MMGGLGEVAAMMAGRRTLGKWESATNQRTIVTLIPNHPTGRFRSWRREYRPLSDSVILLAPLFRFGLKWSRFSLNRLSTKSLLPKITPSVK
jgi:hypothetical protein